MHERSLSWLCTGTSIKRDRVKLIFDDNLISLWRKTNQMDLCSLPVFSGIRVARSVVFFIVFCTLLFAIFSFFFLLVIIQSVFLSFGHYTVCFSFFWSLYSLFFFDLRLLITPLVSLSFSDTPKLILLVKWWGQLNVFHMRVTHPTLT